MVEREERGDAAVRNENGKKSNESGRRRRKLGMADAFKEECYEYSNCDGMTKFTRDAPL